MAYNLTLTNGTALLTLSDGTADTTTTSVSLIGKNYAGYGVFINENFIKMLENFSNNTAPNNPLQGQLWWDSSVKQLKVYDGATWKVAGGTTSSATAPTTPQIGDLWWDTANGQLKTYNGSFWVVIGPFVASTAPATVFQGNILTDSSLASHYVGNVMVNNKLAAVVSTDNGNFNMTSPVGGLGTIRPGYNFTSITEGSMVSSPNMTMGVSTGNLNVSTLGTNYGQNFSVTSGTFGTINALNINGATGVSTFSTRPVFGSNTAWDSGNFTPSNYATLASPALTGTPTAPTAAVNTNSTQIATTAYVVGQAANANPIMNGGAAIGTSLRYARQDHVHPTDTTRAPLASPNLTGSPTAAGQFTIRGGGVGSAGGQLILGFGNNATTGISGQDNSTWNIDVDSSDDFAIFRQSATGVITNALVIDDSTCSVALQNSPTAPTPITGDASTKIANTLFVSGALSNSLSGYKVHTANTGPIWGQAITSVSVFGVTDVGRFVDFHGATTDAVDYTVRLDGGTAGSTTLSLTGAFVASGNITAFSDARIKTDIVPISNALDKVSQLNGYTYTRTDTGNRETGVIAQEVQKVLPEAVSENNDENKTLSVAYGNMVGLLIESIKELKAEVSYLKSKLGE